MNWSTQIGRVATGFALALFLANDATAQGARLQLDGLSRLAERAAEVTDIALDPAMLQLAGNFLSASESEGKEAVKDVVSQLKGIYVKSFEFERDGLYSQADVDSVRRQFTGNWSRLVVTESKRDQELVEVYSWREGDRSGGLAILVAEPRELTIVNIVGVIDLARLAALSGKFGIPNIPTK